jgi:hypothetical protein
VETTPADREPLAAHGSGAGGCSDQKGWLTGGE